VKVHPLARVVLGGPGCAAFIPLDGVFPDASSGQNTPVP